MASSSRPRLYNIILLILIGGGAIVFKVGYRTLVTTPDSSSSVVVVKIIANDFELDPDVHVIEVGKSITTVAVDNSSTHTLVDNKESGKSHFQTVDKVTLAQQEPDNITTNAAFISNSTSATDSETTQHNMVTFYSMERGDRDGGAVQDMLMAHAYAFFLNGTYGGACVLPGVNDDPYSRAQHSKHKLMLERLRLDMILPFACPPLQENMTDSHHKLLASEDYRSYDTNLFTGAWLQTIYSKIDYPIRNDNVYRVAVHIRRQDVQPCGNYRSRYLTNKHYLQLLERYVPPRDEIEKDVEVTIFSQQQSFESMDVFRDMKFSVVLDTNRADTWMSMMVADLLILSKSSFSFVPALLNPHGRVIYTPLWHEPLLQWTIVDDDLLLQLEEKHLNKLVSKQCPNKG